MKNSSRNKKRGMLLLKYNIAFTLLLSLAKCALGQDLDVPQTLEYLNSKFREFPYQNNSDLFKYSFEINSKGELQINLIEYTKTFLDVDKSSLLLTRTYRIAVNKIDIKESFESYHYGDPDDILKIYPTESYYEESTNYKGVQIYKRSVPYANTYRNYISIEVGDAGNLQNIKNAFIHLYTLIISNPVKYGLNKQNDPFASVPKNPKEGLNLTGSSNSIKLIKTVSGVFEVPVILNGVLKINFILDSGASEVSLSPDVALTLLRTGTITENDWLPSQTYIFADGSTAKSNRFLIRKLSIGDLVLTNIEAGISKSIQAPMLLGQNVLTQLGTFTIDYENLLLIITK